MQQFGPSSHHTSYRTFKGSITTTGHPPTYAFFSHHRRRRVTNLSCAEIPKPIQPLHLQIRTESELLLDTDTVLTTSDMVLQLPLSPRINDQANHTSGLEISPHAYQKFYPSTCPSPIDTRILAYQLRHLSVTTQQQHKQVLYAPYKTYLFLCALPLVSLWKALPTNWHLPYRVPRV